MVKSYKVIKYYQQNTITKKQMNQPYVHVNLPYATLTCT